MTIKHIHHQSGISLIEVLVTITIVSVGLLGFAGLQVYSLKSNRIALQRSYATMLAYDLFDCVRANQAEASAYATILSAFTDAAYDSDNSVSGDDVDPWLDRLAQALPEGEAKLTINAGVATIEVRWKESVSSDTTQTFVTETSL